MAGQREFGMVGGKHKGRGNKGHLGKLNTDTVLDLGGGFGGLYGRCGPGDWYIEAWCEDETTGGSFAGDEAGAADCIREWCRDFGWEG